MNRALKAALLSAFVFPGSGHFFLKSYLKGALLAGIASACLFFLLSTTIEIAQEISLRIEAGEIPLEVSRITEAISEQSASSGTLQANISTFLLIICWLVGIIDSYRVGQVPTKGESIEVEEA